MLKATDLTIARGGLPVLTGLSFEVSAGEALVLRGVNGSGKTTLLRTLAGLQNAVTGKVEIDEDQIAYGAHADGIKSQLSVEENLRFWSAIYGGKHIDVALQAFELNKLRTRLAQNLSAGQKRRLGLARLLVMDRPLWLLDEPTVSLDQASVGLFAKAVKTHLSEGGAAVIATHIDLGFPAAELDVTPYRAKPKPLALLVGS